MRRRNVRKNKGFTLLEVAIAIVLIVLVGTTAAGSLRMSLKALGGTESSAVASAVIREFREYTFTHTIEQIDALDGQAIAPILGNGNPMPGATTLELRVGVTPVDDSDPAVVVAPGDSRSRLVSANVWSDERLILEALWLTTEH